MKTVARRVLSTCVLLCALGLSASPALAHQWCRGRITGMYIDDGGAVFITPTFIENWLQICNVNGPWNGITPEVCKTWIGVATTLQVTQQDGLLLYRVDTPCNALPTYGAAPPPAYLMIYPVS